VTGVPDRLNEAVLSSSSSRLKDEVLSHLADVANVAQFVSFGPSIEPHQRFSRVLGYRPNHRFPTPINAVDTLLSSAISGSVNVRSFMAGAPKGGPLSYGLRNHDDVISILRQRTAEGLYTIVNETIDVDDGGVSGVALGGIIEFAPGDTPRAVEKAGTLGLGHDAALRLLSTVYGFTPDLDYKPDERVEFSIHPLVAGVRQTHTIIWEKEQVGSLELSPRLTWPNSFSRFIGDKAFGLLIADLLGLPVPLTRVISRRVAPFRFGRTTGSGEQWLRTSPAEPVPGKFLTQRGWLDPFVLLAEQDPKGTVIASVLAQEGVRARYSGAAVPDKMGEMLVEGVPGFGDNFMLARVPPVALPAEVIRDVRRLGNRAAAEIGPVRYEWVHDGDMAWIVQLHLATVMVSSRTIYPGEPTRWRPFDPSEGLDALRSLIAGIKSDEGVEITGDVGITSHVGDLLRRAAIPSRIARRPQ